MPCYPADVACPFFYPVERFEDGAWLKPPRLPLGDPCRGECTAKPGARATPSLAELREYCNTGYARGRCPRFPNQPDAPDAVRFSIEGDHAGAIALIWILERDYAPLSYGSLAYDTALAGFTGAAESGNVRAQAHWFVASYLGRKTKL